MGFGHSKSTPVIYGDFEAAISALLSPIAIRCYFKLTPSPFCPVWGVGMYPIWLWWEAPATNNCSEIRVCFTSSWFNYVITFLAGGRWYIRPLCIPSLFWFNSRLWSQDENSPIPPHFYSNKNHINIIYVVWGRERSNALLISTLYSPAY